MLALGFAVACADARAPQATTLDLAATPEPAAVQSQLNPTALTDSPADFTYVVQRGDYVSAIATRFNTTIRELVEANGIEDPSVIRVGQELVIPRSSATPFDEARQPAQAPTPEDAASVAPTSESELPDGSRLAEGTLASEEAPPLDQAGASELLNGARRNGSQPQVLRPNSLRTLLVEFPPRWAKFAIAFFVGTLLLVLVVRIMAWLLYVLRKAAAPLARFLLRSLVVVVRVVSWGLYRGIYAVTSGVFAVLRWNVRQLLRATVAAGHAALVQFRLGARSVASLARLVRRGLAAGGALARRAYDGRRRLLRLFGRLSAAPRVARTLAARTRDPVTTVTETVRERVRSLAHDRSTLAETGSPFARAQLQAAAELRRALESRDLRVHYLPILRIGDSSVAGVEAVFPWKHPVRGWTFAEPIDVVVEASGKRTIARPLASHLLTAGCELVGQRQDGLEQSINLTVALSREQFLDPALVTLVESVIEETHFAGEALTIEVTERTLNTDFEGACAIIAQLRDRGVTVALADFSGALSSDAFQKLGVGAVSVDFSGVTRTTRARRLVARTVESAQSLNLQVTAKHVESAGDVQLAGELECVLMQGGACSEPLPPETFQNGEAWPATRSFDALAAPPAASLAGWQPR